jgi:hypothetical protein
MSQPAFAPGLSRPPARPCATSRHYRLVDQDGAPHPVLDDLYESLDAAWQEALAWHQREGGGVQEPPGIGVEVSTASGDWRTVRHPVI